MNNFPFFFCFFLCCVGYACIFINLFFLLTIPFLIYFLFTIKIWKQKKFVSVLIIFSIFIGLTLIFRPYFLTYQLSDKIDKLLHWSLRSKINDFFNQSYDAKLASFIKLVLLNKKDNNIYKFYNQAVSLGIVWMITISGFHLHTLTMCLRFILKKVKIVRTLFPMLVIIFYLYLLNFSYSCTRVVLVFFFTSIFKKVILSKFNILGLVGLIIIFFNPVAINNYGFILSILGCIGLYYISELKINNLFLEKFLINVVVCFLSLPIIVTMNKSLSLFVVINCFIFTYFFVFLYFYFLLFAWIPFLVILHQAVVYFVYLLLASFDFFNQVLRFNNIHPLFWASYYYVLSMVALLIKYKTDKL